MIRILTVLALLVTTSANAALVSRLGGQAFYDDQLDISWAANTNINGSATFPNQSSWVATLEIAGVSGWRLPNMDRNNDQVIVNCQPGGVAGCSDNEMGFMAWENGITLGTPGPFTNFTNAGYWSGTTAPIDNPGDAWAFNFASFSQGGALGAFVLGGWAVHDGDVGVVPVPAAGLLFSSGLMACLAMARRRQA